MATKRQSSYARKMQRRTANKVSATKHGKNIVRSNGKVVSSGSKTQEIYSESQYIFKERYITDHMLIFPILSIYTRDSIT